MQLSAPRNREEFHLPAAFQSEFRYPFIPLIEKGTCAWGFSGFSPHIVSTRLEGLYYS